MSHLDRSPQPPLNLAGQTCSRLPASFDLIIRQQPVRSRMCGVGERVDRRPIDPPPIVQLKLAGQGTDETLQNISPYIFLVAVLVPANDQEEVSPPRIDFHSRLTIGRTVSSLYILRDLDDSEGAFFVFSDISVRVDGYYRLRMCLFELTESSVHFRRGILTDPFTVYSAKKFPGMHLSCRLARHFAQQGLKIRIRKESRKRGSGSRRHSREQDDDDDADSSSDDRIEPIVSNDQEEVLYSSPPYHDPMDDRRFTTTEFNAYSSVCHNLSSSNSSTSSHLPYHHQRRISNAESSSTGKMLWLKSSTSKDDLIPRSNIAFASSTSPGGLYQDVQQQQQDERRHSKQDQGSSKINVASLIHPNHASDPPMDNNDVMRNVTSMRALPSYSTNTSGSTDDLRSRHPQTTLSPSSSSVEQNHHPLQANTSASSFYWRLPPIIYDNKSSPSLSSTSQELYEQSRRRRSGGDDMRRSTQQYYPSYYDPSSSVQRPRGSSPIIHHASSSSSHIMNLHQPQQQLYLPTSSNSPTMPPPPSSSSTSSSIELRPDRPELILQTKPMLLSHFHPQEDVNLPSLREQLGGLVVPSPTDERDHDEQDHRTDHIFDTTSKQSNQRRTSR